MEQKKQELLPVPNTISFFWKKGQAISESDTPGRKFCLVTRTGYTSGQAFLFFFLPDTWLSSPTRNCTWAMAMKAQNPNHRPPGNSLDKALFFVLFSSAYQKNLQDNF